MDPIRYTLSFPAPHTHYVHVRAEVPAAGRDSVELSMAVWTPGSYLVREFSRHVESVTAESAGGIALRVEKTAKNRWRVATGGALMVPIKRVASAVGVGGRIANCGSPPARWSSPNTLQLTPPPGSDGETRSTQRRSTGSRRCRVADVPFLPSRRAGRFGRRLEVGPGRVAAPGRSTRRRPL